MNNPGFNKKLIKNHMLYNTVSQHEIDIPAINPMQLNAKAREGASKSEIFDTPSV